MASTWCFVLAEVGTKICTLWMLRVARRRTCDSLLRDPGETLRLLGLLTATGSPSRLIGCLERGEVVFVVSDPAQRNGSAHAAGHGIGRAGLAPQVEPGRPQTHVHVQLGRSVSGARHIPALLPPARHHLL